MSAVAVLVTGADEGQVGMLESAVVGDVFALGATTVDLKNLVVFELLVKSQFEKFSRLHYRNVCL